MEVSTFKRTLLKSWVVLDVLYCKNILSQLIGKENAQSEANMGNLGNGMRAKTVLCSVMPENVS